MTAHIQKFVDRLKVVEQRGQRELVLSITEAKDLHADMTKLLAVIQELHEQNRASSPTTVRDAEISGGTF